MRNVFYNYVLISLIFFWGGATRYIYSKGDYM